MNLTPRAAAVLAAAALLAGSAAPAAAAVHSTHAAAAAPAAWKSVAVPSSVKQPASLHAVSAVSSSLAWAAGTQGQTGFDTASYTSAALMLRWNGKTWSQVALPKLTAPASLTGVSAASASDAWAIGTDDTVEGPGGFTGKAVVLHWNGTAWASVAFPDSASAAVNAIAVAPNGTAWLVGSTDATSDTSSVLVEEWNGKAWTVIQTGLGNTGAWANNVRVAADGDVWVVGAEQGGPLDSNVAVIGYEHDGTWKSLTAPASSPSGTSMTDADDVLAVSPADLWVSGDALTINDEFVRTWSGPVVYHYNGTAWQLNADPTLDSTTQEDSSYTSLVAGSSGQPQWLGGSVNEDNADSPAPGATTYEYYSSTNSWSAEKGATTLGPSSSGGADGFGAAVTNVPGTNAAWAVGGTYTGPDAAPCTEFVEYNTGA
jgi:hypothetical protein